ncbi:Hypothetical protein CINCED_3A010939 [Cinara cedri]|uniref:Uncharacterized protein n=1 Tax=Cinara cedri TaxID=506608 RepID=A0A5E4MRU4_9HEMI|nr:Hypothetical protein CINCED_3A010939 [Cinara cedri]
MDVRYSNLGLCREPKHEYRTSIPKHLSAANHWLITLVRLKRDPEFPSVNETAATYYERFRGRLLDIPNRPISESASLTLPGNPNRRLKRNWRRDPKTQELIV